MSVSGVSSYGCLTESWCDVKACRSAGDGASDGVKASRGASDDVLGCL